MHVYILGSKCIGIIYEKKKNRLTGLTLVTVE
jgi:hypothetical protein